MKKGTLFMLIICSSIVICLGQGAVSCEYLRQIAEERKALLEIKRGQNAVLRETLREQRTNFRRLGIVIPDTVAYQLPTNQDPIFDRERGWRGECPVPANPGITYLGDIVFWRTVNLKRAEIEQEYLMAQQVALDRIYQGGSEVAPISTPIASNRAFGADRKISRTNKTFSILEVDPAAFRIEIAPAPRNPRSHAFQELNRSSGGSLLFAMNAGMYDDYRNPVGLLIKDQRALHRLNRIPSGYGNFYKQPNGVFYVTTDGRAAVVTTQQFYTSNLQLADISLATQSGPMMIIDRRINEEFTPGSSNLHFRNAVGVTRDGKVIFAISKQRVNFYEFSAFLLDLGCVNALYLDGAVSRMYLPTIGETSALDDSAHLGPVLYILE